MTDPSSNHEVLLTVSGTIPDGIESAADSGARPRTDYVEMANAFGADLIDHRLARAEGGRLGALIGRIAGDNALLAWRCRRRGRRYGTVFTDGEQVGFPLAASMLVSRRRPRHVMIGHRLTPRKKRIVHRLLPLRRRIDLLVVYSSAQERFAIDVLGYPPDRVVRTPFMVDARFWDPAHAGPSRRTRPMICALGRELRDYPTLIEAVRDLDLDLVISTASAWSKRADEVGERAMPSNVEVRSFDIVELRQLYADAAFVVVPLLEADFQSGITTILEAMSMGRAVICTRTTGQCDTVVDGVNGIYVPPGDVRAMRTAIERLAADPAAAQRLGDAGRRWVEEQADVRIYAARLATLLRR